ncbi:MAG: winged helix-turn-helix transcriptional regulator [Candidatus Bathyarchaeota archaeon]|nr:MAG: winged helix-turn-helix transcriptional regulator [Candidatus Bathyarchaeota archaeon]
MSSDELFGAVSHPLRIEIVKALAERPLRFADLKRKLRISSSGLLDFHLKKLDDLITTNEEGCYSLSGRGFAALTTVESAARYYRLRSAQKRSFLLNLVVVTLGNIITLWVASQQNNYALWYAAVLPVTLAWMIFYSYWTIVKRRIRLWQ